MKNILMAGGKDKVSFKYYSYRVEFQARGMPHIHGVAWISPEELKQKGITGHLCDVDDKTLTTLVESLLTCELPKDDDSLLNIVNSVQIHHHTKSCLKHNGKCRYGFPKLPSNKTIVAQPLPEDMDKEERKQLLEKAKDTLRKAVDVLNGGVEFDEDIDLDDFVKLVDKDLSTDEYLRFIGITEKGKSIILKRSVKERFVNNYNK